MIASPLEAVADRLIPTREVAARFGYTPAGLLAAARGGRFPPPVKLSRTRCAWWQSVLDRHMASLKATREGSTDAA
jgi:predicted DNA-binding transcriptional regulator AlpA